MNFKRVDATVDNLRAIRDDKAARLLVWPTFKKGIFMDMQTANALVTVYDALNDEHKATFAEKLADGPGYLVKLVEFAWKMVK